MRHRLHTLAVTITLLTCALPVRGAADLESTVRSAWSPGPYRATTEADMPALVELFDALMRESETTDRQARALDMELVLRQGLSILRERPGTQRGRGIYLFRARKAALPLAWQAPHARDDRHTDRLAARLMASGRARALAVSTVPRSVRDGGATVDADLAHQEVSWMMAFTQSFARAHPDGHIVQMHGFGSARRKTAEGRSADVILSPGHLQGSLATLGADHCLARAGMGRVLLYPDEVRELGGTTNSMSQWLIRHGFTGFIHLELGAALRDRLLEDAGQLEALRHCLEQSR